MSDETPGASEPFDVDAWLADPSSARLINAFTVELVIRYMRDAAQLFENDYESAMIFLSVLETNGRQNVRAPWFREQYADVRKALPAELARPVSRQAIAQSLGLSRETVRRKIAAMIKRGLLFHGCLRGRDHYPRRYRQRCFRVGPEARRWLRATVPGRPVASRRRARLLTGWIPQPPPTALGPSLSEVEMNKHGHGP